MHEMRDDEIHLTKKLLVRVVGHCGGSVLYVRLAVVAFTIVLVRIRQLRRNFFMCVTYLYFVRFQSQS